MASDISRGETEKRAGTNEGKLWGGRFAGGPSRRARGVVEVHPLRLAAGPHDLAGSRAHARVLHAAGLLPTTTTPSCSAASTCWAERYAERLASARAGRRGRPRGPRALLIDRVGADVGGRLRAGRSRNDQVATLFRVYLRDHARAIAGLVLDLVDALVDPGRRGTSARPCPAARTSSTPSRCCSPTTCWPTPGRCCATSSGCATGTPASPTTRRTARARWPGRARSASTPRRSQRDLGFTGSVENSIDGTASPRLRRGVRVRHRDDRRRRLAGSPRRSSSGRPRSSPSSRSTTPTRPGRASCRRRRTPTSPSWPAARPAGWSATSPGC